MASLKLALQVDSSNPVVGDLYLHNGTVRLTASLSEEVAQLLWTRLRSFRGEWFLDPTVGMVWLQSVLGQKTPIGILTQVFLSTIAGCPGVASVPTLTLARTANRGLSVKFVALLRDGATLTEADFSPFVLTQPGV